MIIDIQVRTEDIVGENRTVTKMNDLHISYFNKEGDVSFLDIPLDKEKDGFVWDECSPMEPHTHNKKYRTWDNKPVRRVGTTRLNKYRIEEILATKTDEELAPLLEFNIPKKFVLDIETEVTEGFPDPEKALNKVTAISIVNCADHKVTVLALKKLDDKTISNIEKQINDYFKKYSDTWKLNYVFFESEYDMLYTLFAKLIHKMPCITGWNVVSFDWTYLVNRCERLKINPAISSLTKILVGKDRIPQHKLIVDYLEIVKKWDRVIKIKENNKLDYIAEVATGLTKIKYNGSFKDLYEQDFLKFIFYNAVDSILVHYIDKRLNTLITFLKLAQVARVEINRAFSPIHNMEALMCREFFKRDRIFIDRQKEADTRHFEGAYVKPPITGFHEWITCFDFASLYPSLMRQFNISPENFKGKKSADHPHNQDEIITANDNIFDATNDSVLRTILEDLYGKRKTVKKTMLSINKEVDQLKKLLV